ncbi:alpha/beta hydrolase [Streptomyces capparidis]
MPTTTRTAGLALAASALLPALLAAPAVAAPTPGGHLTWRPCPAATHPELHAAGARCTRVTVPLDHADPGGRTIRIAVSRIPAQDPARRRGILLANPGGPGGPGLDHPGTLRPALGDVADRYDLIGFDPRFVGESTPVTCAPAGTPAPVPPTTTPRESFERTVASARDTARRCFGHADNASLLPHASTRDVARDMDAIRAALGERKLSYYGVSYGADLGAVYTQLFPHRADRFVLDSSTDPSATQYELFRQAGPHAEAGLDEWAAWTARHAGTYRLGTTARQVREAVERLARRTDHRPIRLGGYTIDRTALTLVLRQLVQHEENDDALARAVRNLTDAAAGEPVRPEPELDGFLALLHSPDADRFFAVPAFTMCADGGWPAGGWPADPETYWRAIRADRRTQPVFGPLAAAISPCPFWPAPPREPGTAIGNDVPLLMLQALRDNNTPHPGGLALHHRLTGSRLITADIRSHGVYARALDGHRPVPCADEAVNRWLRDGVLPVGDYTVGAASPSSGATSSSTTRSCGSQSTSSSSSTASHRSAS